MSAIIRSVLDCVDDPHAFATAYVAHVEATDQRPAVTAAVQAWIREGKIA